MLYSSFTAFGAQFLQDINGRPYLSKTYEEYEGSPLLFKSWVNAKVVTAKGQVYEDMLINIDLYQDMPLFIRDGQVYTFIENIAEFSIVDGELKMTFRKGRLIDKSLPDIFYHVLSTDPMVLKNSTRKVVEVPSYGDANKKFRFAEGKVFYAFVKDGIKKISLNKSDAEKVFADKWKAVNEFATQNGISFKSEEGWQKALKYHQGL